MKKRIRKTFAFLICIVMVVCCMPSISSQAATQSGVSNQLNSLISQYAGRTATSAQMYMGSQCKGFANWVFKKLFGVYIGPYPESANYKITNANAQLVGMINPGGLNESTAKALLQKAKPGDYIQVQRSIAKSGGRCGPHSMIVVDVKADGVQIFDCNSDGRNTIKTYLYTWSKFDYDNRGMSLYHAYNYQVDVPSSNGSNSNSSFESCVNLGTNFYAYIINTYAWKHLTNDNCNVSMRTETGAANQIWRFERQGDGSYKIINYADNKVLDDQDFGQKDGTNVAVCNSNDSTAQRWFIYGSSGAYYLRAKCGNLLLDVKDASKADGANVQMWTKNGSVAQKFQIWKLNEPAKTNIRCTVGTGYAKTTFSWDNVSNAKNYDLKIWKNQIWQGDAYQILWNLSSTSAQVVLPPGYYEAYVDSKNGGLVTMSNVVKFTVSDGKPLNLGDDFYGYIITSKNQLALTNSNGNVDVRNQNKATSQIWHFNRLGNGAYTIQNTADNKYLDTDNSRDANGTNIKVWTYNGSDAQKYFIYGIQSGQYALKPACATRFVDVCGGKNNSGDNVQLWDFNAGDAQSFSIVKTNNPIKTECTHKFSAWTVTKKATCTAGGTEQRKCSVCGKVESRTVKATGHNYINKVIDPTATQQGYTLHTCSACGYSYKDNYTNVKKQLQSIAITVRPDKTVYNQNDSIDTTGLKVVANYTDGSKSEVRGWQISGNTATLGKTAVKISYTEGGITKTASYEIEVKEKAVPKENVSLTYDANGGSMSQTMQSGTKGSTIKISDERPVKSVTVSFRSNGGDQNLDSVSLQQSFMRWVYSSASGEIGYYPGDSLTLTENCTLRAQYNVARLTSLPKLQRSGYTFDGWYTQNNIPAYEGMVITGDTVLTAHWTKQSQNADDNQSQTGNVSDWSDLIDYDDVEEPDEDDNDIYSVGDEFATDQAVYTVTKMGDDFCVEYSEMFDDDVESTYIPDTITINGTVYRVTSVGEKAFYKNKSLKSIVISGYIEKIDAKAFYGCTSLKEITITSTKLKTGSIGANAFKKVNKNVRVIVPTSKYKAYKKLLKKAGIGTKAKIYKLRTL